MKRSLAAMGVLYAGCAFAQTAATLQDESEAATEQQVAGLSRAFGDLQKLTPSEMDWIEACKTNCHNASPEVREGAAAAAVERAKGTNRVTAEIHKAVDEYVYRDISPSHFDPKSVREHLRQALGATAHGTPYAFMLNSGGDRQLVIVYTVQKSTLMGSGATSVTVRGYASRKSRFALVGSIGDDLDGYAGVRVIELDSPIPGELWLLMWGQMTGANGPNVRMRIYAYDRTKFRPIWMPENEWGTFTVRVTQQGFRVDGPYYREGRVRHDSYSLARDGVYRINR
jgi:hypothetical protein